METKAALRKRMALLKSGHAQQRASLSRSVLASLEALAAFREASTVLLYHSLPDEVDTHAFVEKWAGRKCVLLPVVVGSGLELRRYTSPHDLAPGAYGILEPVGEPFTDYSKVDFVAVPGVAFDRSGHRLGRGKGYYDRLLPLLPRAYKAGICFPYQLVDCVPCDAHDVSMHRVICG